MIAQLRGLLKDTWVLGIAAAIGIGYAAVRVVAELVAVVFDAINDVRVEGAFVVEIGGRDFAYQELLASGLTLLVIVALAALLLARSEHE